MEVRRLDVKSGASGSSASKFSARGCWTATLGSITIPTELNALLP